MGTVYATRTDLTTLCISDALLSGLTDDQITAALTSASTTVDSYIGTRFDLPLTDFGQDIVLATCRIAAYLVLQGPRGFNPGASNADSFLTNHNMAVSWLKDVAAGRATPSFPDTKDATDFNPDQQPFVLAPASGNIGVSTGGFRSHQDDEPIRVGTAGPPRSRGW